MEHAGVCMYVCALVCVCACVRVCVCVCVCVCVFSCTQCSVTANVAYDFCNIGFFNQSVINTASGLLPPHFPMQTSGCSPVNEN